jgi:hypothetical protein
MEPEVISGTYLPYTNANTKFIPIIYQAKISLGTNTSMKVFLKSTQYKYLSRYAKRKSPHTRTNLGCSIVIQLKSNTGMHPVRNKWLCQERICPENKVLHLMLYYQLKLYWMKVCWLHERS